MKEKSVVKRVDPRQKQTIKPWFLKLKRQEIKMQLTSITQGHCPSKVSKLT